MPKLKVYCTPIGFHDAYVAAPSQKAALKAWGTTKNLFSRGAAEVVTDPKLTREPLEKPGEIIKRARGGGASHTKRGAADKPKVKPAKRSPPPDRTPLDEIERAIRDAETRHRDELDAIEKELEALQAKRRKIVDAHDKEVSKLEKLRDTRDAAYRRALRKWEA